MTSPGQPRSSYGAHVFGDTHFLLEMLLSPTSPSQLRLLRLTAGFWCWHALYAASMYGLRRMQPKLAPHVRVDLASRIVSTLHAVAASVLGYLCVAVDEAGLRARHDFVSAAFDHSDQREIALLLTASYLIYDFCLCLWHWRVFWDVATLLHHVAVVTAFLTGTTWTFGTFHMSTLLLNELSTPFVNARVALLAMGKQQSSLYAVNGWCMALSFFFARILFGTAVVIHVGITYWVMVPREWHKMFLPLRIVTVSLAIITLCHAALNYWWFSRIVAHVLRAMKRSTKAAASAGSPTPAVAAKAVAAGGEAAGEVVSECSEPAATPVEAAVDRLIAPTPDSARSLPLLERTAARARAGAKAR